MRSERLAEAALSVVASPERTSAAVGDLLELAPTRGRIWFWRSILFTALAIVWRHFRAAPLLLTFYAALSLVGYSLVILLLALAAGQSLVVLLWIGGSLGLSGDFDERALLETVGPLVIFVVAPYLSGRRIADVWHERALALTMALAVWLVMLSLVFVAAPGRTMNVPMLLWIVPFMMAGVVRRRLMTLRRSHAPVAE